MLHQAHYEDGPLILMRRATNAHEGMRAHPGGNDSKYNISRRALPNDDDTKNLLLAENVTLVD